MRTQLIRVLLAVMAGGCGIGFCEGDTMVAGVTTTSAGVSEPVAVSQVAEVVPAHLDYFPSRLHAAVYRNWEIVPLDRLAEVLETTESQVRKLGMEMGLSEPPVLTAEAQKRNHETVLRRNWPVMPRKQIEALLGWTAADLDKFLATDIAFGVLLGEPPPDLKPLRWNAADGETTTRTEWFAAQVKKHRALVAGVTAEPRFEFIKELSQIHNGADHVAGREPLEGDADLRDGWQIQIANDAGPVIRQYAQDFASYCKTVHGVKNLDLQEETQHGPYDRVLTLKADNGSTGSAEGYRLEITPTRISIVGNGEMGVARGLLELERRMGERGGAFLSATRGVVTMKPSFSPRYVYPYFAPMTDVLGQDVIDPAPDGYLARVARQDADGIWLFCVLEDMVESPVFEGMGKGSAARRERLKSLVERAGKYGLKVYLYFNEPRPKPVEFFNRYPNVKGKTEGRLAAMCTSTDEVLRHVKGSFEALFREVPGLGGTFIITSSENLTHCYAHGQKIDCERCKTRSSEDVIAELIKATEEGVHASAPEAPVIVWDWSWHSTGNEDPQEQIVKAVAPDCMLMADFERGTKVNRGGVPMTVDEYSISVVGPSPRAQMRSQQAKELGVPFLAKIQLSNTWECGTVPWIPVPGLLAEKAEAMTSAGVSGCMQSWTLGGGPSPNTEAFAVKQWNPKLEVKDVLARVAQRRYGTEATTAAVNGWTRFGEVFAREYPYSVAIYTGPIQYAPGLPWYRNEIPEPYGRGAMLNPKGDWKIWTNPYSAEQMAGQLRHMCSEWSGGLSDFKDVVNLAAPSRLRTAERDYGVAWIVDYTFRSFANTLDFYRAREGGDREEMKRLAAAELEMTKEAYRYVLQDSRLGWEAQLQYYYQPGDVLEKLVSLEAVLAGI